MLVSLGGQSHASVTSSLLISTNNVTTPLPQADAETTERKRDGEGGEERDFFVFLEARRARMDSTSKDEREFEDEGT